MEGTRGARIQEYCAELTDPRVDWTTLHLLPDMFLIALCAVICGAETSVEIGIYGRAKEGWLEQFLPLPHGIPSHDTFGCWGG